MKYSKEQLKNMAQAALRARDSGDIRWLELVTSMSVKTREDPAVIESKIEAMAAS